MKCVHYEEERVEQYHTSSCTRKVVVVKGRGNREKDTWREGTDSGVLLNQEFPFKGKKLHEVKQCRERGEKIE